MKSYNIITGKVNSSQKRKKNIEKVTSCLFELGGGNNMCMIELKKVEDYFDGSKVKWKAALYPVLDIEDEKFRSLFVVSFGCDELRGVNGVTIRWINELYNKMKVKDNVYDLIMKDIVKKDKKGVTSDVINTLVYAFIHEPAIEFEQKDKPISYNYLFGPPTNLPKYLEYFAS